MKRKSAARYLVLAAIAAATFFVCWLMSRPSQSQYERGVGSVARIEIPEGTRVAEAILVDIATGKWQRGAQKEAATEEGQKTKSATATGPSAPSKAPAKAGPAADKDAATEAESGSDDHNRHVTITRRRRDGTVEKVDVVSPEEAARRVERLRKSLTPESGHK